MQITDPVADMLTRIRNANTAKHESVDVPASNLKKAIAKILLDDFVAQILTNSSFPSFADLQKAAKFHSSFIKRRGRRRETKKPVIW